MFEVALILPMCDERHEMCDERHKTCDERHEMCDFNKFDDVTTSVLLYLSQLDMCTTF